MNMDAALLDIEKEIEKLCVHISTDGPVTSYVDTELKLKHSVEYIKTNFPDSPHSKRVDQMLKLLIAVCAKFIPKGVNSSKKPEQKDEEANDNENKSDATKGDEEEKYRILLDKHLEQLKFLGETEPRPLDYGLSIDVNLKQIRKLVGKRQEAQEEKVKEKVKGVGAEGEEGALKERVRMEEPPHKRTVRLKAKSPKRSPSRSRRVSRSPPKSPSRLPGRSRMHHVSRSPPISPSRSPRRSKSHRWSRSQSRSPPRSRRRSRSKSKSPSYRCRSYRRSRSPPRSSSRSPRRSRKNRKSRSRSRSFSRSSSKSPSVGRPKHRCKKNSCHHRPHQKDKSRSRSKERSPPAQTDCFDCPLPTDSTFFGIRVSSLPLDASDLEIQSNLAFDFEQYGHVIGVSVTRTGEDRVAVVTFKRPEEAFVASLNPSHKSLLGDGLVCSKHYGIPFSSPAFCPPPGREWKAKHPRASRGMIVHGVLPGVLLEGLRPSFSVYGTIRELRILVRTSWQPTVSVCVTYEHLQHTLMAMLNMDGERIPGISNDRVTVDFAESEVTDALWIQGERASFENITQNFFKKKFLAFSKFMPTIQHGIVYFKSCSHATDELKRLRESEMDAVTVDYATKDDRLKCRQLMPSTEFPLVQSVAQEEVLAQRLLLLSNIPASMSLMEIRKLVSPFGSLLALESTQPLEKYSLTRSVNVRYHLITSALIAQQTLHQQGIKGFTLQVKRALADEYLSSCLWFEERPLMWDGQKAFTDLVNACFPSASLSPAVSQPLAFFESIAVAKEAFVMFTTKQFCKRSKIDFACHADIASLQRSLPIDDLFCPPSITWPQTGSCFPDLKASHCIRVSNLPASVGQKTLEEIFSTYGVIKSVTVASDDPKQADIVFSLISSAVAAKREMNNELYIDQKIQVTYVVQLTRVLCLMELCSVGEDQVKSLKALLVDHSVKWIRMTDGFRLVAKDETSAEEILNLIRDDRVGLFYEADFADSMGTQIALAIEKADLEKEEKKKETENKLKQIEEKEEGKEEEEKGDEQEKVGPRINAHGDVDDRVVPLVLSHKPTGTEVNLQVFGIPESSKLKRVLSDLRSICIKYATVVSIDHTLLRKNRKFTVTVSSMAEAEILEALSKQQPFICSGHPIRFAVLQPKPSEDLVIKNVIPTSPDPNTDDVPIKIAPMNIVPWPSEQQKSLHPHRNVDLQHPPTNCLCLTPFPRFLSIKEIVEDIHPHASLINVERNSSSAFIYFERISDVVNVFDNVAPKLAVKYPNIMMKFGPISKLLNVLIDGVRPPLSTNALKQYVLKLGGNPKIFANDRTGQLLACYSGSNAVNTYKKMSSVTLEEVAGLPVSEQPKRLNVNYACQLQCSLFHARLQWTLPPTPANVLPDERTHFAATRTIVIEHPSFAVYPKEIFVDAFKQFGRIVDIYRRVFDDGSLKVFVEFMNISHAAAAVQLKEVKIAAETAAVNFAPHLPTTCIILNEICVKYQHISTHFKKELCDYKINPVFFKQNCLMYFGSLAAAKQVIFNSARKLHGMNLLMDFASQACQDVFYAERSDLCSEKVTESLPVIPSLMEIKAEICDKVVEPVPDEISRSSTPRDGGRLSRHLKPLSGRLLCSTRTLVLRSSAEIGSSERSRLREICQGYGILLDMKLLEDKRIIELEFSDINSVIYLMKKLTATGDYYKCSFGRVTPFPGLWLQSLPLHHPTVEAATQKYKARYSYDKARGFTLVTFHHQAISEKLYEDMKNEGKGVQVDYSSRKHTDHMLLYQRIPLHLRQVDWDRILASREMEIQSGSPCRTLKISGFPDWTEAKDVHELFFIYGHIVMVNFSDSIWEVEFASIKAAQAAHSAHLDFCMDGATKINVFFSASRGEGNCLFIETTERADERMEQRIRSLAACYGRVLKFFHDKAGSTLVLYSSTKDGRKALDQLKRNRHVKVDVAGRKLQAIFTDQQTKKSDGSHSKACRDPEVDIACSATIEISRLCDDVSEDSLRETFSRFGAIKAVVLKKSTEDTNTAEVEFEERCNVPKAVAEMDGLFFSLTKISVSMVRLQSRFLWLSGIPSQFSGSILQSGLYRYGKFTSFCRVATCIVLSYESVESAAETIDAVKRKGLAMFRPRIEFVTEEFAIKMQKEAEKLVPETPDAPSQEDDDQKIEPQAQATKETTNFLKNRKFRLKDAPIKKPRHRLAPIKSCGVVLQRLSPEEISKWTKHHH